MPVQQGRPFVESDDRGAPSVVILNASAARLLWPGMSAIGRRVRVMDRKLATVIGLVPDTRYRDLREARPSIYFPLRQSLFPYVPLTFAIRAAGDPLAVVPALRHAFAQSASGVALESADSFESLLGGPLALPRLNALLLSVFAAAALLLAAVGLYAVVAAAVRQRTREFGIRLALGASPGALGRTVLREALAVAVVGTGAGVVGALALSRAVRSLVFEVSPSDPATLGAVALLLLLVAVVAAHPPARHAARTDPLQALRTE
jgi:hypothetical protein